MYNLNKNGGYTPPTQFNQQYGYAGQPARYPMDMQQGYLQMAQIPAQMTYFKGRPVVSIDEARAAQIDFDGSLYVFTDLGKGKIYTKQFNPDGTATLHTFVLEQEKEAEPVEFATKAELDTAISNLQETLTALVKESVNAIHTPRKIEF